MITKNFQQEYNRLNPKQKEAVEAIEGPVMVIAGPGTGKTQIMAMRIANILRQTQVSAGNILALTFTESGVHALKERLLKIVGPASYSIQVHTFHSFCNEIILSYPEKFAFNRTLDQLTELEQIKIIQKILDKTRLELIKPLKAPYYYQSAILKAINDLKQEGIDPQDFLAILKKDRLAFDQQDDLYHTKGAHKGKMKGKFIEQSNALEKNFELQKVFAQYQQELERAGLYDYADMILFVLKAFTTDVELLSIYQERFQYLLVDEYQDTNASQNEIVRTLASFHDQPNVFVVGDDEQSIFRFQGASLENILYFKKLYPKTKIIMLKENYRSGQTILDASRGVIQKNQQQIFHVLKIDKSLKSKILTKANIYLGKFTSGEAENFFLAQKIKKLIKAGANPSEIAVLYRKHQDAKSLAEILSKSNIPYRLTAGENVLDDLEIKKLIKIFKVLNMGPETRDASRDLFEVLHFDFFQIEPLDIYKLTRQLGRDNSLFDLLSDKNLRKNTKLLKPTKINSFVQIIMEIQKFSANHTFAETFEFLINRTGFLNYLLKKQDSVLHLNRLESLFSQIKILNVKNKDFSIATFCEWLDLMQENNLIVSERELDADFRGVNLLTAHKAKGLEFETVFIMHLADKHWGNHPSRDLIKLPTGLLKMQTLRDTETDLKLEEERRLFYVAMTRAKKNLFLTYAEKYSEGDSDKFSTPAVFLSELPIEKIEPIETASIEKKFSDRLELSFAQKKWHSSKKIKDFLKAILADFYLSPTALNTYLDCPQKFYFDNLLRVPKVKTFDQAYGTAVHQALELLFRAQIKDQKLPSKAELLSYFKEALRVEILTQSELERAWEKGSVTLSSYYDFYKNEWQKTTPIGLEVSFSNHQVHLDEVPINGKIDKIELIDFPSKKVRVVDFKTSKPKTLNYLLGKTKEQDLSFYYQAYFYKMLAEQDPLFKWQVVAIEFDFTEPSNGKFTKVQIPIEPKAYDEFKKIVKDVYAKISQLDFSSNRATCQKHNRPCQYADFCENSWQNMPKGLY